MLTGQEGMYLTQSGQGQVPSEMESPPMSVLHQPPPNHYPDLYGQDFIYQDYGPHWPVPTLAECIANHVPFDFVKYLGNSEVLPVFSGDVTLFPGWRSTFFNYVHVQNVPVMFKCHALDKSVKEGIRESLFYGLDFSSTGYKLRLQRLEDKFGGLDLLVRCMMGKLAILRKVTQDMEHLQRAVFVLQQVISTPQLRVGSLEVAALVLPYLPAKVRREFSYYCLTFQPNPLREDLFSLHKYLQLQNTVYQKASFELESETTSGTSRFGSSHGTASALFPTAPHKSSAKGEGVANWHIPGKATCISNVRISTSTPNPKGGLADSGEGENSGKATLFSQVRTGKTTLSTKGGPVQDERPLDHGASSTPQPLCENFESRAPVEGQPLGDTSQSDSTKNLESSCEVVASEEVLEWDPSLCAGIIRCEVPKLRGEGKRVISLNAYYDTCATDLVMPFTLAEKLKLQGPLVPYEVLGHGGRKRIFIAMQSSLTLLDRKGKHVATVPVYCYDNPVKGMKVDDWSQLAKHWPHLKNLKLSSPKANGEVQLVIGTRHAGLLASVEPDIIGSKLTDPVAKITQLGVFIMGRKEPRHCAGQLEGKNLIVKRKVYLVSGGEVKNTIISVNNFGHSSSGRQEASNWSNGSKAINDLEPLAFANRAFDPGGVQARRVHASKLHVHPVGVLHYGTPYHLTPPAINQTWKASGC